MSTRSPVGFWSGVFGWFALTFFAAALGSYASIDAKAFYAEIARPSWAPPGWLFGPVWTVLYLLMFAGVALVWRCREARGATAALWLYGVQLALNALWTWLFFTWRQGAVATLEIALLWALILSTILAFWRVQRLAAILLIPYLLWVSFASVLSFATWRLNPDLL
jgi:tryptophan-rich sensory protein